MCRVVATFSERRSIVAESLPIDRQRGAVSEPFEMIAASDVAQTSTNAEMTPKPMSSLFLFRCTLPCLQTQILQSFPQFIFFGQPQNISHS